ncbi:MAG: xylanase [Prevotella sp.]|nr:xylanase [Prevotella sp.]
MRHLLQSLCLMVFSALSVMSVKAQSTFVVTLDDNTTYQTIMDFGASDCWTADFVGKYFNDSQRSQAARWLFSQGVDVNGNPEGIGLSCWRINLGAGSAEQGSNSNIADETRRAECYLLADGTYNWNKSAGQQYFMQQAKAYGVDHFLLFSNSAPVHFTNNGLANNKDNASGANLKADCYDDFANFIATTAKHFADLGYPITYVDPVNEPAFNWTDGQEGSPWQNTEIAKIIRELDLALTSKQVEAGIVIPEANAWDRLYQTCSDYNGRASNQIEAFWNPANTDTYIGNLAHVVKAVAGHDYWTFGSNDTLTSTRSQVAAAAGKYGLQVMQTEWSMLDKEPGTDTGFPSSYDAASEMDIALFMGKLIHVGLTYGNFSSWAYWTAMAQSMYSQKNRFELIRLNATGDDSYESYGDLKKGGTISATPNLWVLGNYSRFVRPGYTRIGMTGGADNIDGLMGTAFLSPDKTKAVVVFVNNGTVAKGVRFTTDILGASLKTIRKYITDATHSLSLDATLAETFSPDTRIVIPQRSVVTLAFDLGTTAGISELQWHQPARSSAVYSLDGTRVAESADDMSRLPRGIYIVNGKKIIKQQ